jgi:hypothetical protein
VGRDPREVAAAAAALSPLRHPPILLPLLARPS